MVEVPLKCFEWSDCWRAEETLLARSHSPSTQKAFRVCVGEMWSSFSCRYGRGTV